MTNDQPAEEQQWKWKLRSHDDVTGLHYVEELGPKGTRLVAARVSKDDGLSIIADHNARLADQRSSGEQWVTPEQARESLHRFIASHFSNHKDLGEHARFRIPADPTHDDDLILSRFIDQANRPDPGSEQEVATGSTNRNALVAIAEDCVPIDYKAAYEQAEQNREAGEEITRLRAQLNTAQAERDTAEERAAIAYGDGAAIYLTKQLATAQANCDALAAERDAIVALWPWEGDLQGKTLLKAIEDEMADYKMIIDNCTEIYGEASGWATSKPQVLPSVIVGLMNEREERQEREAVADVMEPVIEDLEQIANILAPENDQPEYVRVAYSAVLALQSSLRTPDATTQQEGVSGE